MTSVASFDSYEYVGVIVPGSIVVASAGWLFGAGPAGEALWNTTVGGLGIFVILAFVAGHLLQAVGNGLEAVWWRWRDGMPTDWIRDRPSTLISASQSEKLAGQIRAVLKLDLGGDVGAVPKADWHPIVRQVYAAVATSGRAERVDQFNRTYGLLRGIAAGCLSGTLLSLLELPDALGATILLGIATGLAIFRMDRFGRHYARELFVQFLQLPTKEML